MFSELRYTLTAMLVSLYGYALASTPDTLRAYQHYVLADSMLTHAQYDSAVWNFQKAADMYKEAEVWGRHIGCFNKISKCYWKWGRYEEAKKPGMYALNSSLEKLESPNLEEARAYHNLGVIAKRKGNYSAANNFLTKALTVKKKLLPRGHPEVIEEYNGLAGLNFRIGKLSTAKNILLTAIEEKKSIKPWGDEQLANFLNNLGLIYWSEGRMDSSIYCYEQALKIRKSIFSEGHPAFGACYNGLGLSYMYKGLNHQAIDYFSQAMGIFKSSLDPNHVRMAHCYHNLGFAYQNIGEYEKAILYSKKSLAIRNYNSIDDKNGEKSALYVNLGIMYFNQGILDSAQYFLDSALYVAPPDHWTIAESLNYQAKIWQRLGLHDKSLVQINKAIEFLDARIRYKHPIKVFSFNNKGDIYFAQNHINQAIEAYESAIGQNFVNYDNLGGRPETRLEGVLDENELLRSILGKALSYEKASYNANRFNNLISSLRNFQLCDSLLINVRRKSTNFQDKFDLVKATTRIYEGAIRVAMTLYEISSNEKYFEDAFKFAEKSKAGILRDALNDISAKSFSTIPDSLMMLEESLKAEMSICLSKIQHEESKNDTSDRAEIKKWQSRLFKTNNKIQTLIEGMEKKYPKYFDLKYDNRTVSIDQIQSTLADDTALIEYFYSDSLVYVFVINNDTSHVESIKISGKEAELISSFRNLMKSNSATNGLQTTQLNKVSYDIYSYFLESFLGSLAEDINKLIIIPDGPLNYLPFDILLTNPVDTVVDFHELPYLIKDYNTHYVYSGTLHFGQLNNSPKNNNIELLSFAPVYTESGIDSLATRDIGRFRNQVTQLNYNGPEVNEINRFIQGQSFIGHKAVERAFKKNVQKYGIVHLAMHALVDDENPMNSRLMFSQREDSVEDNFLHAYELYNMKITAKLAVLSACETGFGKFAKGEGVMSLARAFSYAGCPSVVMSHWSVNDAATAKLMKFFYAHLANGERKDQALRAAKLEFLAQADPIQSNPFFWGSFVVMGDVSPVQSKDSALNKYLIIALIFLLTVTGYVLLQKRIRFRL